MGDIKFGGASEIGKAFGSVTDTLGITDHAGQAAANQRADAAAAESSRLTNEQLDFQRQQYNDWKDIYGTLQEQEMDYIQKYTGADVVANQLAQNQSSFQGAESNLTRTLAQRGLSGSGTEAAALTSLASQQAMNDANIRNSQDTIAEQKRLGFLGLGLGQGAQMLGVQANVANAGVGAQANIAGQQSALAGQLGVQGMRGMSSLYNTSIKAIGDFFGGQAAAG